MSSQILVVDDTPAIRDIVQTMLTYWGYTVTPADSGDAVVAFLGGAEVLPDLILLDLLMPHHNGWSLLATLREHAEWRRIPVVVMSGVAEAEEQAAKFNCFCLPKPFSGQALLNIVECYCTPPIRRSVRA
jgi:CheY-like chemotaxis protein